MRITTLNNKINFGKTPILTCYIKESESKNKVSATLYKMDPHDSKDVDDIRFSKQARILYSDFLRDNSKLQPTYEYYLLQNDKTKEVISCAQTSHHFRPLNSKNEGLSTLINEIKENPKYINGAEPLLGYIAKRAEERFDNTIYTAFRLEELPSIKRAKFTETKLGEHYMPQKRFKVLIDQAEKHSQIEYLI